jgi:uncharacterized protein
MRDYYIHRTIESDWQKISRQFPALLLTGPRQVGKTTLLEHLCEKNRKIVSLDDLNLRSLARRDPALFLQRYSPPVLIDEIQYAPELFPAIKSLIDQARAPGAFWLTGSQQFQMMKGVTESLAGRVAIVHLLGFSARERQQNDVPVPPFLPTRKALQLRTGRPPSADLDKVYQTIWQGSFPAMATGAIKHHDLFYRSYLQTYLQRDVRDLSQVGDLETFARYVRACAARTAQLLNYADLARDCGISINTARNWMSILMASFMVYLLPPYHNNITKRLYKTPKLYFLDTGLCAYLTEWTSPKTLEAGAMSGAILETHVIAEILKSWWNRVQFPNLYYYRDKDGREIDLLISKDNRLYPVEIKKAAKINSSDISSFTALRRFNRQTGEGAVICLCPELLPIDSHNSAVPVNLI